MHIFRASRSRKGALTLMGEMLRKTQKDCKVGAERFTRENEADRQKSKDHDEISKKNCIWGKRVMEFSQRSDDHDQYLGESPPHRSTNGQRGGGSKEK